MSGSLVLSTLPGATSSGGAASLLAIAYGQRAAGGQVGQGGDPLLALRLAEKNRDREIAAAGRAPEVQRDVQAFRKAVAAAGDADAALANPAILKVLLTANGLSDQLAYTALARRVLLSDPADPAALVNRIADTRWKSVVQTFQFATKGMDVLSKADVQTTLADGYAEVSWRKSLEKTTPGLADALDFRARANSVGSAIEILGDAVLRRVVTTTLQIPQEIAFQELPAQERAITTRLDLGRLKDAKFVDAFSQRYLLARQAAGTAGSTPDLSSLAIQARGLTI